MKRFIEGVDRGQGTLFPERLEDWIAEDNPVRVIDVFVDELDLGGLGFDRVLPEASAIRTAQTPKTRKSRPQTQKVDAPQPIKPPMIERRAFPHNQDQKWTNSAF
jgi:hypothetical protein